MGKEQYQLEELELEITTDSSAHGGKTNDRGGGTHKDQIESPIIPRIHDKLHILQAPHGLPILLRITSRRKRPTPTQGPGPEPGDGTDAGTEVFLRVEVGDEFGLTDGDISVSLVCRSTRFRFRFGSVMFVRRQSIVDGSGGLTFLEVVQDGNVILVGQPFVDLAGKGGFFDLGHDMFWLFLGSRDERCRKRLKILK